MASGRKITVEFLGNNRDLDNAMDGSVRRSSKFAGALKKAGRIAGLGLAAGAILAGKALFDMTKGAIEDEAAQKRLALQLQRTIGASKDQVAAAEDWISTMGEQLGVADDDLRPALGKLAAVSDDLGEAQRRTFLAMNIAADSGQSLESVTKALVAAENGRVTGLGKYGVATKDAEGKTRDLNDILLDLTEKTHGAAEDAADTTAGKMQRLKVAFAEAGEEIGYKLIPVVTALAEWFLDKGLPAIQQFGGWMRDNLGPIFSDVGRVMGAVFGFGGGGAGGQVEENLGKIRDVIMQITGVIRVVWKRFGDDIVEYARNGFLNAMQVIGGVLDVIRGIVMVFSSLFKGDWQGVWDGIKLILSGALDIILGLVKQALNLLHIIWTVAWAGIKALAGAVWDGIKALTVKGIDALLGLVKSLPGRFVDNLSTLKALASSVFHDAMAAGLEKVKGIGGDILSWIAGIPGKLLGKVGDFKEAGKALIGAVVDGMKNAAGLVEGIASNVWDAVKGLMNSAIDKINSALEFTINVPGAPDIHINPPNIPHLAKGGIVSRPTLALIGEDGPEAVVPLGRKNAPRGGLGVGSAQAPISITVVSWDPRSAGKAVVDALRDLERTSGRQLLVTPA